MNAEQSANMNAEQSAPEEKLGPHTCPYCKDRGKRSLLTPKGRKLECSACGNVFWASDPTGAKSRNEAPR